MSAYRRREGIAAMAFFAVFAANASADDIDVPALLEDKLCVACHDETKPLIGPPYRAIAARHSAQAELMEEVLAAKILLGGAGNWGVVPMVPNDHVTETEARAMARWILGLR